MLIKFYDKAIEKLNFDYVKYKHFKLPLRKYRYCGVNIKDDEVFLKSAFIEVEKMMKFCDLSLTSTLLDVGSGQGRIPIGIIEKIGTVKSYKGIDIDKRSVNWCKRFIEKNNPSFQFSLLNIHNSRYNPKGKYIDNDFKFPFEDNKFEIIYLFSVFSHMLEKEVVVYLKDFKRMLKPNGKVLFTTFVEEDVPDVSENPDNYKRKWEGALHCVRYNKDFLFSLVKKCGFKVDNFEYGTTDDGQSYICLSPL